MLILTRRPGESTLIGEDIEVFVLEVRGNQVRLGIKAPENVVIVRDEIVQRGSVENRRLRSTSSSAR